MPLALTSNKDVTPILCHRDTMFLAWARVLCPENEIPVQFLFRPGGTKTSYFSDETSLAGCSALRLYRSCHPFTAARRCQPWKWPPPGTVQRGWNVHLMWVRGKVQEILKGDYAEGEMSVSKAANSVNMGEEEMSRWTVTGRTRMGYCPESKYPFYEDWILSRKYAVGTVERII